MITVSLCMIVKNEEEILARCLDSVADLMDEIIIVDTGSTDRTKEIASRYTSQVYDFTWQEDFSAARNFSFSKASMEYIYAPDADEVLDEENRERFRQLKEFLLPEIEIVQMKYHTVSEYNTVLNAKKEYRPKLFKRLRSFTWIDPIHETVQTAPVIYDSEIEILHMPQSFHHKRDFSVFLKAFKREGRLSGRIRRMYAKELLKMGDETDFSNASAFFLQVYTNDTDESARKEAACVLAHFYRITDHKNEFFKLALKDMLTTPCSEICYELGLYFEGEQDYDEAVLWFYNAAFEAETILDIHMGGDLPLHGLVRCYEIMSQTAHRDCPEDSLMHAYYDEQLEAYRRQAAEWALPEEN